MTAISEVPISGDEILSARARAMSTRMDQDGFISIPDRSRTREANSVGEEMNRDDSRPDVERDEDDRQTTESVLVREVESLIEPTGPVEEASPVEKPQAPRNVGQEAFAYSKKLRRPRPQMNTRYVAGSTKPVGQQQPIHTQERRRGPSHGNRRLD